MRPSTRFLLLSSAVFLAILGFLGSFLSAETIVVLGTEPHSMTIMMGQLAGALYLGFAIMNFYNRRAPMGGIYGRPLGLANLIHFLLGALMLIKLVIGDFRDPPILILTIGYSVFAVGFGMILFTDPSKDQSRG